jgi:hypothetical protein
MMWLMLLYSLIYAPTLALTNSIAFINLQDSEKDFGKIRVWGTIGWIAAGLALTGWRLLAKSPDDIAMKGDMLILAGVFSIIMGFLSFGLPKTPPKKEGAKPWAFLEAFKMFKNRNFLVFALISFVVATELQFYYVLTSPFLTSAAIGVSQKSVTAVMKNAAAVVTPPVIMLGPTSRAVSTTSRVTVPSPLSERTRPACVSNRSRSRKFPPVIRTIAATASASDTPRPATTPRAAPYGVTYSADWVAELTSRYQLKLLGH